MRVPCSDLRKCVVDEAVSLELVRRNDEFQPAKSRKSLQIPCISGNWTPRSGRSALRGTPGSVSGCNGTVFFTTALPKPAFPRYFRPSSRRPADRETSKAFKRSPRRPKFSGVKNSSAIRVVPFCADKRAAHCNATPDTSSPALRRCAPCSDP